MRVLVFVLCLVAAHSALSSNDYPALQKVLDANRGKWRSQGIVGYDMTISRICFCIVDAIGPFEATVKQNQIVKISPENQFSKDLPTVEGVFEFIQNAIKERAANIDVEYDAKLGYPTRSFVDFSFQIADEERGFELEVKNIKRGPKNSPPPSHGDGFDRRLHFRNLAKWRSQRIRTYKYELTRACFCLPNFVGPFIVKVVNDRVVQVEFTDRSKGSVPDAIAKEIPTINRLFRIILQEAAKADEVTMKYDPKLGYPTSAAIDRIKNAIDDEITYIAKLL